MTPHQTIVFWEEMCRAYGTRVIPKTSALEMRLASRGLESLGVLERERFMTRYTTAVWTRIYPSFVIGRGDADALWSQVVTCVHEHQHVEQFRREGALKFSTRYLASSRRRALYEAEAYACNMELYHWRDGRLLNPVDLAVRLRDYGCKTPDIEAARQYLAEVHDHLKRGGEVRNAASRRAIEILAAAPFA